MRRVLDVKLPWGPAAGKARFHARGPGAGHVSPFLLLSGSRIGEVGGHGAGGWDLFGPRLVCAFIAGLATSGPCLAQPLSAKAEAAIDAAMQAPVTSGWTAGGAVAVMRRGEVVFARGYGSANLETGTPATPDTIFRIGSLTKQFTAAAMLLLQEDGKLAIDDRVSGYIREFPAEDPTTIRQLLTHTSGIADYVGRPGFRRETLLPHSTDELVAYVLTSSRCMTSRQGRTGGIQARTTLWRARSSNGFPENPWKGS